MGMFFHIKLFCRIIKQPFECFQTNCCHPVMNEIPSVIIKVIPIVSPYSKTSEGLEKIVKQRPRRTIAVL